MTVKARHVATRSTDAASATLAALAPLLACPACRSELDELQPRGEGWLICRQCDTRFPLYRNGAAAIPWLFRDADAALLEWRARFNSYLHASSLEQKRLTGAMSDPHCSKAAAMRIKLVADAKEIQRRQIFELLAPLGLDAPRGSASLDRSGLLHGRLPRQHGLLSYYDNVFRDWAWENGENERLLECLARVLQSAPGFSPGKVLTLGAGAARLPYDFHRRYRPELSIALDLNPLLVLLASRMIQGHTVPFYEFPIAPLDRDSFAVPRRCAAPEALAAAPADFALVLGDGTQPPFRQGRFDTVITSWYIDIVPQDLADCIRTVNRLLKEGGVWLNTGSLAFFHRNEALCYSEEETIELLRDNGFEVLAAQRDSIPYLQSPSSAYGRVERVFSFCARKVSQSSVPRPRPHLPQWIREPSRPVPDLDEFVVASAAHLLKAQALAAVDGRRTIDEIAADVAKRYGLQKSEARRAVERILLEIFEAAALDNEDAARRLTE